jgi:hypothetical protein
MALHGSSIISKSTMRRCTERKALRSRPRRRPRIRVSGVMECRVMGVAVWELHLRVGHAEKSQDKISYGH